MSGEVRMRSIASLFLRKRLLVAALGLSGLLMAAAASASVVITGTRVIYPGGAREKTVQLTNEDAFPNVVQAWVDINNPQSMPDQADAPFLVTPPMFRMEPKAGQSLRLIFTGQGLPQDRESVFYLNVLQIPPLNAANADQNQLLVMLRNRLKLFYRPSSIVGKPEDLAAQLHFSLRQLDSGWVVQVDNPTGYYASLASATLSVNGQELPLHSDMVAPKSQASWPLDKHVSPPAGPARIHCLLVNDYGAHIDIARDITR
jgi:fimbrial chaperone protein